MSVVGAVLLVCAVLVVLGAEWPRFEERFGSTGRKRRERARRKASLQVLRSDDEDDFAASVERDLARLPTIEEREERR